MLFARRRDLFTNLDLVFFDTTSLHFHRPRRRNAGPVRQEQGRPQRLQADGSRDRDRRRRHSGGKPHVAGQHCRCHHSRPGGRAPSGPVRRQAGVPGRRRRDDLEAAGRGGRGPGVGVHSRGAAARHQGGARHRSRRSRPVRDRRGRAPTPDPMELQVKEVKVDGNGKASRRYVVSAIRNRPPRMRPLGRSCSPRLRASCAAAPRA